jgi:hypothetical protein
MSAALPKYPSLGEALESGPSLAHRIGSKKRANPKRPGLFAWQPQAGGRCPKRRQVDQTLGGRYGPGGSGDRR